MLVFGRHTYRRKKEKKKKRKKEKKEKKNSMVQGASGLELELELNAQDDLPEEE